MNKKEAKLILELAMQVAGARDELNSVEFKLGQLVKEALKDKDYHQVWDRIEKELDIGRDER